MGVFHCHQAGALNRMGVRTSPDEAKAIVNHYDLTGSGEMSYEVFYVLSGLRLTEPGRLGHDRTTPAIRVRRLVCSRSLFIVGFTSPHEILRSDMTGGLIGRISKGMVYQHKVEQAVILF